MKKSYWVICGKCSKFEKSKISYLLERALVLSVIFSKCKNEDEQIFKEKKFNWENSWFSWKYIITLKIRQENISQEIRLKNIDETRNYLIEEINRINRLVKSTKKFVQLWITLKTFLI